MGNGMNKIIPNLYIGNFRDAKDVVKLTENNVDHIVAIYDNPTHVLKEFKYKCIDASDSVSQDLSKYFYDCIKFIHKARSDGNGVLVHCIAGVSRSTTITAAYLIVVSKCGWREAIEAIRVCRSIANPNYAFQRQLEEFELKKAEEVRRKLLKKYKIDPADQLCVQELLQAKGKPEPPIEARLNSETFKHYEKQRQGAKTNEITN
ncbi:dual specificity protein phosphatase 22-B-like [Rhopilema esculentum]|uniref:dual specificity protein phosphatase 22-B-like n=1 Tax=Rhopilema esculentum TaxID=499914 RepID=UPI0031E45BB6